MTRLLPACPQVSTANLKAQGQTERPGRAWKTLRVRVHAERRAAAERTSTRSENTISPFYSFYACSINHCNCISWDSYSPEKPSQVWESWGIVLVRFVMR